MKDHVFAFDNRVIYFGGLLFEYAGIPVLFWGYDDELRNYLCYYGEEDERCQWAVALVDDNTLYQILSQELAVYSAFTNSDEKYLGIENDNQVLRFERIDAYNEFDLPESGTIFDDFNIEVATAHFRMEKPMREQWKNRPTEIIWAKSDGTDIFQACA